MTEIVSLEALAARVAPLQSLAVPVTGVAMAATAALIESGATGLKLICVPVSGLQADLLIGAEAVAAVETSAVSLGEAGGAPRFTAAVREGAQAYLKRQYTTIGIVGIGNVGRRVAELCGGLFRMQVIAYDPFLSPERAVEIGVEKVELDDLLARAEIITLHTPLT